MNRIFFLLISIFALHGFASNAQDTSSALYVHTDKHIYTPGETIWFKAYFNAEFPLQETLHVKIIDLENNSIVTEREFPVYDIRAHGQIVLSDSVSPGSYHFIAFGNRSKNLDNSTVYLQNITIAAKSPNMLRAKADVLADSKLKPGEMVKIAFQLKKGENNPSGIKGVCTISSEDHSKIYTTIKLKTDNNGIATASFTYPNIKPFEHLYIKGDFTNKKEHARTGIYLPSQEKKIITTVSVEGGQLLPDIKNKILVTLKDDNGLPVKGKIIVNENDNVIKSAITDSLGTVLITFTPLANRDYEVVRSSPDGNANEVISLPVSTATTAIRLVDTKTLQVINYGGATIRNFELWCGDGLLFSKKLNLKERDSLLINLPKSNLNTIISAVLRDKDSMLTNERLFVQGNKENYKVTINVSGKSIKPHEKVTGKISIEDANGNPVEANLSIAVVSARVIDKTIPKTIKGYPYNFTATHKELQDIMQPISIANNILIGRQWRSNVYVTNSTDSLLPVNIKGRIKDRKNKPAYLDKFTIITTDGIKYVKIEKDGTFVIPAEYRIASEGQQNYIFTDGLKAKSFHAEFDSLPDTNKRLTDLSASNIKNTYTIISKEEALPVTFGQNILDEVVIEKKTFHITNAQYQSWVRDYPKNCRDYVCNFNVINCPIHPEGGTRPVIGKQYSNGIYKRCLKCDCISETESNTIPLKSITRPENFVPPQFVAEYDVKYYSTLYWKSNLDTDATGKGDIEFTASDVTGAFKIIIQGITKETNEAIYGEGTFEVIPNY